MDGAGGAVRRGGAGELTTTVTLLVEPKRTTNTTNTKGPKAHEGHEETALALSFVPFVSRRGLRALRFDQRVGPSAQAFRRRSSGRAASNAAKIAANTSGSVRSFLTAHR